MTNIVHVEKTLGQTAYEGYCEKTDNKSLVSGAQLPYWEDLSVEIQNAWEAAAIAVVDFYDVMLKKSLSAERSS